MIYKSIAVAIFIFIAWTIVISIKPLSISQNQWQRNIIIAEKYLIDSDSIENVIVGSSLATRMVMDDFDNFDNLSLVGQSVFDGLKMLRLKEKLPKKVFIEVNVLDRSEDENFNQIISSPISMTLKSRLKALRSDKQPLSILSAITNFSFSFAFNKISKDKNDGGAHEKEKSFAKPINTKMLQMQKQNYSKEINLEKYNHQFEILTEHINFLESKNTDVIFFEIPVNAELINLEKANYLRTRVQKAFPQNIFIQLPQNVDFYKTTDGLHLTKKEAKVYSTYFMSEVQGLKIQ